MDVAVERTADGRHRWLAGRFFDAIRRDQLQYGNDTTVRLFARILDDVNAKLHDIIRRDFVRFVRFNALIIDKRAVAAAGVFDKEFPVRIPNDSVVTRQHFAIEYCVCLFDAAAWHGPADFRLLPCLEQDAAFLC